MAEVLLKMLARAGQTIQNPFSMGGDYIRPRRGEIARDLGRVTGDMKSVGKDLKKAAQRELQRHGK